MNCVLCLRVSSELRDALDLEADERGMGLADFVREILKEHVEQRARDERLAGPER